MDTAIRRVLCLRQGSTLLATFCLMGVDRPGCEQVLWMAILWQSVLSNIAMSSSRLCFHVSTTRLTVANMVWVWPHTRWRAARAMRVTSRPRNWRVRPLTTADRKCWERLPQPRINTKSPKGAQPLEAYVVLLRPRSHVQQRLPRQHSFV